MIKPTSRPRRRPVLPRKLFAELRRRHVWRAAVLYGAVAWLLVQIATQVFPLFDVPNAVLRAIVVVTVVGFPIWIALAWYYELTPQGIRRDSGLDAAESAERVGRGGLDPWILGVPAVVALLLVGNLVFRHEEAASARAAVAAAAPSTTQAAATGAPAETAEPVPARSIAVLPFVNESSDPEQEYFADGISEDLLDLLTKVPALRVAARTSSFSFKGQNLEVLEIARRLHVSNVLQGSVRRSGDELRISAQLVHASDGYQVWSQTWKRRAGDVFAIQDEIARDVVAQLRVRLLSSAPTARETDPRAYALFLQAREIGRQRSPDALARSDSLYQQVLAIDRRYAPAWVERARNLGNEAGLGALPNREGFRRAREAAERAVAIDPGYAAAHAALGDFAANEGDAAGAARHIERALALDPADPDVLRVSAAVLQSLGRLPEVIPLMESIVARDPVNPTAIYNLGLAYRWAGRYDDAIARQRMLLSLRPGFGGAHAALAADLLLKGDTTAALAETEQETTEALRLIGLPLAYHGLGREAESDSTLEELIREYPMDAPYNVAYIYAFRGEPDSAFAWLDRAVEYGDPGLSEILVENLFASLRSDPRWLPFLRRVGKAPEQVGKIRFEVKPPERPD